MPWGCEDCVANSWLPHKADCKMLRDTGHFSRSSGSGLGGCVRPLGRVGPLPFLEFSSPYGFSGKHAETRSVNRELGCVV